ncbi:uncharacterized protein LOC134828469 [Culicoides brevitarsis]|uniref:uncharacterized protein LOC134828469 n=1 Tax=Culicoides brevitarsis TaxID=469753 RepID=UPI00307BE70A
MLFKVLLAILGVFVASSHATFNASDYENNVVFYTWNSEGAHYNFTFTEESYTTFQQMCPPPANWTIISHAWQENFQKELWTDNVVQSFLNFRGGCVMFFDYDSYAKSGYFPMVTHTMEIAKILIKFFEQMETMGYDPADAFLFGNGFSSHLFFIAAYNYSPCTIGRIDSCDAAKAKFLNDSEAVHLAPKAAKNVICYHTSRAWGTHLRYCQKNINFGRCGIHQPATVPTRLTNHELCPYFYNNTFTVNFPIVPKEVVHKHYKTKCRNSTITPNLLPGDRQFAGPRLKTCIPNGEYYVLTEKEYPYNVPLNKSGAGEYDYYYEYDDNEEDDAE